LALDQLPPRLSVAAFTAQAIVANSSSHPGDNERVIPSLLRWLECWILPRFWETADGWAAKLLQNDGSPEVLAAINEFRSADGPIGKARQAEIDREAAEAASDAQLREQQRALVDELDKIMKAQEANMADFNEKSREREERNQRLMAGQGTEEDLLEEKRELDKLLNETPEITVKSAKQQKRALEEQWAARARRWKAQEEEARKWKADNERTQRLLHGLATEDDLAATTDGDSDYEPWAEPAWTEPSQGTP
jgi:hypothetical protein